MMRSFDRSAQCCRELRNERVRRFDDNRRLGEAKPISMITQVKALSAIGMTLAALIGIGAGKAQASAGCDAVNAGEFDQTIIGGDGGATISNFAIGDSVTFVVNSGGGDWDLITGNDTTLAAFGAGPHTWSRMVTGAQVDTTLQTVIGSAGRPISVTATCTPAAASRD